MAVKQLKREDGLHEFESCMCDDCQNESYLWYFKMTENERANAVAAAETAAWFRREAGSPITFMFDALAEHLAEIRGVPGKEEE